MAKPIPDGYHSLTPHLVVKGVPRALEFYKKAFDAELESDFESPDGKVIHAEMRIGDSVLMLCEECPEFRALSPRKDKTTPMTLHLYVEDCDAVFAKAIRAGAKKLSPLRDMFWGDRYGQLVDPFGHTWEIATHIEDLTAPEMQKRVLKQYEELAK